MANEKKNDSQEPVEVVALERGHDGTQIREEGERFYVLASRLDDGSTWFKRPEDIAPTSIGANAGNRKAPPPGAGPTIDGR